MSNELLYQYSREGLSETQQPLTAYTKANLIGNGVTTITGLGAGDCP